MAQYPIATLRVTQFRVQTMSYLMGAPQFVRERWTRESPGTTVWLKLVPSRQCIETDWVFPETLADFIFSGHDILIVRQGDGVSTERTTKTVLCLNLPRIPRVKEDIKYVLAWLEFYASDGEPPQFHPKASRSFIHRHMRAAQLMGVPAMVDHLNARIAEMTVAMMNRRPQAEDTQDMQIDQSNTSSDVPAQHYHDQDMLSWQTVPEGSQADNRTGSPEATNQTSEGIPTSVRQLQQTHLQSIQAAYGHPTLESFASFPSPNTEEDRQARAENSNVPKDESPEVKLEQSSPAESETKESPVNQQDDTTNLTDIVPGDHEPRSVSMSPQLATRDGFHSLQLTASNLLRSPHTPANSAISRARSHLNDHTNGGVDASQHGEVVSGNGHQDTAIDGQSQVNGHVEANGHTEANGHIGANENTDARVQGY